MKRSPIAIVVPVLAALGCGSEAKKPSDPSARATSAIDAGTERAPAEATPDDAGAPTIAIDAAAPPLATFDAGLGSQLPCPLVLSLTRKVPPRKDLAPPALTETTESIVLGRIAEATASTRPFAAGKRVAKAENAFALDLDSWLGDAEPPSIAVKYAGATPNGDRFTFTVRGERKGFGLCHGIYELFSWSGSFVLGKDDRIDTLSLTGAEDVAEDHCTADGRSRKITMRYRGTYSGQGSPRCDEPSASH